ncbi:hypothetical protein B7L70_10435 [Vulcanisaeta sp. EB80]|nr:hypothetical protein B7L70_10435 [Vulcanisaeta sp. EB80]
MNTNYVEPPPAETTTYVISLSEYCPACLNCPCTTYANVNVYAYAFKPSNYVIGLLTSLNGAWVGECWSSEVYASPGPFNLSISQCQLPSSYDHVGIPLYYYPTGGSVWIQSVDIYGLGQYCTLAAIPPKISNVTIAKNSGVTNVPGYEFSVYIDSPSTENYVTLTIYYGSTVVYQVYKYVQLPSQWASCTTLRVDFGPIQPLVCGTYTIVATESTPGGSQSQYTTTLNVPCPYTTITLIVDSGGSVVVSGNASGTYTGPTTTTINVPVGSEVTFTAAPGSGYVFSQWLVNGSSISANPITLTINGPTTIEAVFGQAVPPTTTIPLTVYFSSTPATGVAVQYSAYVNGELVTTVSAVTGPGGSVELTIPTPSPGQPVTINVTVQSWRGILLDYTYSYTLTSAEPITITVPSAELVVTPVNPSGGALVSAVVNITCSGIPIASGVGQQTVVVPIPSSGSITCTITGSSNGMAATTVTLTSSQAGQVITRTLVIPVSEHYTPNMGFIMLITVIALLVAVLAVLIVVILRLRR